MTQVHYFPRYTQAENFVTNNTLLLLFRLHQYNRFKFERMLSELCGEQEIEFASPGLTFSQQIETGQSIVDGYIAQDSIKVAVETKLGDRFDLAQLRRHLGVFKGEQHQLLILLSVSERALTDEDLRTVREEAATHSKGIQILQTSFERICERVRKCLSEHDEEMIDLVGDYEAFCSEMDLLATDRWTMFVPPCGRSFEDNVAFRLYYCPDHWSRRKAAFLGVYYQRAVRKIGRIGKVVACEIRDRSVIPQAGQSLTKDEEDRIRGAAETAEKRNGWDIRTGHKFFLCDEMVDCDFRKESPGGIQGHRYFDLKRELAGKVPEDLAGLSAALGKRRWR
jgi:hypothetical protein